MRKTPYQESGLIVASLSSDAGRLDFLFKGARRLGGKKYPDVDLFRELEVRYRDKEQGLLNPSSVELLDNNDAVAGDLDGLMRLGKLATYLLRNCHHDVACPRTYAALAFALSAHKRSGSASIPLEPLVRLVHLDENGLLHDKLTHSDGGGDDSSRRKALEAILRFAVQGGEPPSFSHRFWQQLAQWIGSLCAYHGMEAQDK